MEDHSSDERFLHGLNPVSSSNPTQPKGRSEFTAGFDTQTNPSPPGQLTREPSRTTLSAAGNRRRETEPGCKCQCGGASSLGWTAPRPPPFNRSSSTLRGASKNYRGSQALSTVHESAKHASSSAVTRPVSVGPSFRRPKVVASNRAHATSVDITEQRRLARHRRQVLQFKSHSDNDNTVPRCFFNAEDNVSSLDGANGSVSHSGAHQCTASDASADPDLPHLQKRRTWMLLQHLVDQLEKEGRSDALLQRPDLLQKLLHVVMPLVPLRSALGKFATNSKTTSTSRLQGSFDVVHQSATRTSQQPSTRPESTASFRTLHTSVPPRNSGNRSRLTSLNRSRPSPSTTFPVSTMRGLVQVPRGWNEDSPVAAKQSLQYPQGPADASRSAFSRLPKDIDSKRASSTRTRVIDRRDMGSSTGSGGLEAPLHWYDKPRPVRAVSTGNSYMHVASRLPQGAIQHRRTPKKRSNAALLEKKHAERKPVEPSFVGWATSPCHSSESVTEPAASARSGDSEDTVQCTVTPSLENITEEYPEGLGRQLGADSLGLAEWIANRPQSLVRFTVTREVEALPPSPPDSYSDGEMPPSSGSGRSALTSQGSPVPREELLSLDRGAQSPGLTKNPAPTSGSKRRQPVEPRSTRRHTVAANFASPQCSAEEDKLTRNSGGSLEVPLGSPERRERRLSAAVATKFKSTAAAIKGGRLVLVGEELDGAAKGQGMARIPLLKDIPKARDGRRATVQVVTPRDGSPRSPKLPAGAKRRTSPVLTKKIGKKGSRSFQNLSSISPRDLSPPSARARRMSAPPPRRATQAKIAPTLPSRSRNMADRSSSPRASSAAFKNTARRKTVRLIAAKEKCKTSNAQKDEDKQSTPPMAESKAPHDGKSEEEQADKNKEAPQAVEPEPEPPYPYLTLKELPALEQPLRPLSHLCALPFKDCLKSPPPVEDSVTLLHVLERSERLTQDARDEATQRALSYLCSDGPGTMLMVARWLDSAADAVESNTITASEKFPWREVVPPLFVGVNRYRELLSSKMPRNEFSPKELREFLETEGFLETQGQKLQHLLEAKGIPVNTPGMQEGSKPPKRRTPLDDYLDYLLAVAVDSLRKRQKPVVIPKITKHHIGVPEQPVSSCCCGTCCSDQTCQGCQETELCRSRCTTSLWGNPPLFLSEKRLPQQRCSSCLPIRGPSRGWFGKSDSLGRGFGFTCCYFGDTAGPPELDLFESTAIQQVRAAACRMPLLPSERYLQYLRLTGRCRELTALAIWLSGRPDVVSSYYARMASKQQPASTSLRVNSSNEHEVAAHSPTSAATPVGEGCSPPSSAGCSRRQQEGSPYTDETSQILIREGEAASEEHRSIDAEKCRESSKSASPCSLYPLTSPLSLSCKNGSVPGSSSKGKNTNKGAESPTAEADEPLHTDESHSNDNPGTSHTHPVTTNSPDLPSSPKIRAKLRTRAADPQPYKVNAALVADSPRPQRISATPTTAAKAKAKKHAAAKTPVPRVATIGQKTVVGSKPLRPLGQAQWQVPAGPGQPHSVRDPQRAAKTLPAKQGSLATADTAKCELPESVGTTDAMLHSSEKVSSTAAARTEDLVKSSSHTDADKRASPARSGVADIAAKRPRDLPVNKHSLVHSKTFAQRSSSIKRSTSVKHATRKTGTAPQPERTGADRRVVQNGRSPASRTRLTEEAMDLLSEPQVLAEMARLCTRLSDLVCCRSTSSPVDSPSGDDDEDSGI